MKPRADLMMPKTGSTVGVAGFGIGGLQLGPHGETPGFGDAARGLPLGRGAEVVGPVRLGAADGDQRLDVLCLEGGVRLG